jgi:tRNA modification GTPase
MAPPETIAAIATATGRGGVGIVRVSGPDAIAIVSGLLGRAELPERQLVRGVARAQDGERLDDVLAAAMRGPRSFTGEDVAEVFGHGGTVNMGRLLREVMARGARPAEPGEFTRRAFENGKLDLTRAEALLGVIEAGSERAWRVAQAQLAGGLGARVDGLRAEATVLLAEVEASIDFPEEDLAVPTAASLVARCTALAAACAQLAGTFRVGRALRRGVEVAIVGPVNAGKSSLFNALVGRERAIVSAEPGTTRDYVEAQVEWDGVAVTLIDTAGWRSGAADAIEQRGIELARERVAQVDVVVVATEEADAAAGDDDGRRVEVRTKCDDGWSGVGAIATSARTGRGLAELRAAVLARAGVAAGDTDDPIVVSSERQRGLLDAGSRGFAAAAVALDRRQPLEMVALDVRDGTRSLAEIVGAEVGEAMLDELFARFCIGK